MKKHLLFITLLLTLTTMAQEIKKISYVENSVKHQAETIIVKQNAPAVLILPAWMGIDDESRAAAKDLANQGYNVLIADIYGSVDTPTDMESAKKISSFYKENAEKFKQKIQLAFNELIKLGANKDKIAVIGYCFGGTGTLEAARANMPFSGIVSIHGGLKKVDKTYNTILPKVLVIHPAEDASVSKQDIDLFMDEMRKGNADWQFFYYGNSKHTFTNPQSKDYNTLMTERAWKHVKLFLQEVLK
jgi:dienelactone hydrolase